MKRPERGASAVQKAARNCITLARAMDLKREIEGDRAALERYRRLVDSGCYSSETTKDFRKRADECNRLIARKESELARLLRPE